MNALQWGQNAPLSNVSSSPLWSLPRLPANHRRNPAAAIQRTRRKQFFVHFAFHGSLARKSNPTATSEYRGPSRNHAASRTCGSRDRGGQVVRSCGPRSIIAGVQQEMFRYNDGDTGKAQGEHRLLGRSRTEAAGRAARPEPFQPVQFRKSSFLLAGCGGQNRARPVSPDSLSWISGNWLQAFAESVDVWKFCVTATSADARAEPRAQQKSRELRYWITLAIVANATASPARCGNPDVKQARGSTSICRYCRSGTQSRQPDGIFTGNTPDAAWACTGRPRALSLVKANA